LAYKIHGLTEVSNLMGICQPFKIKVTCICNTKVVNAIELVLNLG